MKNKERVLKQMLLTDKTMLVVDFADRLQSLAREFGGFRKINNVEIDCKKDISIGGLKWKCKICGWNWSDFATTFTVSKTGFHALCVETFSRK